MFLKKTSRISVSIALYTDWKFINNAQCECTELPEKCIGKY